MAKINTAFESEFDAQFDFGDVPDSADVPDSVEDNSGDATVVGVNKAPVTSSTQRRNTSIKMSSTYEIEQKGVLGVPYNSLPAEQQARAVGLIIFLVFWFSGVLAALIVSSLCFRNDGSQGAKIGGVLMAVVFGPFYFLYFLIMRYWFPETRYCLTPAAASAAAV